MSAIYFESMDETSMLYGSERAYMGVRCTDLASVVVSRRGFHKGDLHQFTNLMGPSKVDLRLGIRTDEQVRSYLSVNINDYLVFNGERHGVFETVLNTVIATGSPALCLLAVIHGSCEIHGWVDECDRAWLADVISQGRADNILRPEQGWENVAEHLRNGDGGPIVMSYSVTAEFPNRHVAGWEGAEDNWYDLGSDEQWRMGVAGLKKSPYRHRQITPENLTRQGFTTGKSLWDAVQSPEWSK